MEPHFFVKMREASEKMEHLFMDKDGARTFTDGSLILIVKNRQLCTVTQVKLGQYGA